MYRILLWTLFSCYTLLSGITKHEKIGESVKKNIALNVEEDEMNMRFRRHKARLSVNPSVDVNHNGHKRFLQGQKFLNHNMSIGEVTLTENVDLMSSVCHAITLISILYHFELF